VIAAPIIALIEQILRLINLLIEGTPIEQRRATAIAWFHATWPFVSWALPADIRKQVEEIMARVQA
jgi:hypothetical protein